MYDEEISPEKRKEYQDAFEMFDKDKDGAITARELGNMMRSIGQNPTDEEVMAMIKEVDLNSDGKIELDEFMTLMARNSPDTQTEDEVINAFRVFDKEGNVLIAQIIYCMQYISFHPLTTCLNLTKSSGVVILKLSSSPSTIFTFCPALNASSVLPLILRSSSLGMFSCRAR